MTRDYDASPPSEEPADVRAREVEAQMTDEERFSLLVGFVGAKAGQARDERIPQGTPMSAGYVPGVPRLGVPPLLMTDASLGVTNPGYRQGDTATALPAGLAIGATFDPALAREAGAMIGREARARGFNVLLGGGCNLARDPRNGRNFEYLSEDPLVSGLMAAAAVEGTQSEGVISTVKHYCLNANETNRHWLDAVIDPDAHRESDLLAFQIAIERARPGSVMSAYNQINGEYAGTNEVTLNEVLKGAWGYRGWVMSDWGATLGWEFALHGLDQECGAPTDRVMWGDEWFDGPLKAAHAEGTFPRARLSDMVRRILRSIYAVGLDVEREPPIPDAADGARIALDVARRGIVLLKNDGLLPLSADMSARVGIVGGYAHLGVVAGTGSSLVTPAGGFAGRINLGGVGFMGTSRSLVLHPTSPVDELARLLPEASVEFEPGMHVEDGVALARRSDLVIVFAIRVEGESFDLPDLTLPWGQDALIEAVADANPNTIVVLENGSPVTMPWHDRTRAVVEAWYPGQEGGRAIAEVLTGAVNPSGRLPLTFPMDLSQTPRPELPGAGTPWGTPTTIEYVEGAEVGHRWFAATGAEPLFAFGHGLSYTSFEHGDLEASGGDTVTASITVTNTGERAGVDVPQLYLLEAASVPRMRLLGFERVHLAPGQARRVTFTADPRLLATFDGREGRWHIEEGSYRVGVGASATDLGPVADVRLEGRRFGT